MFAGVGGFRAGLTRVGGFQCVGHCEIDKYAEASYRAIHDIREEERYYNAAWLHGYADALTNVADALEHQKELMDSIIIIGCMGEQYDSAELYDILHNALAMSDEDILSLGFDLPQCHEYDAEISPKRPKGRKFAFYER